MHDLTAEVKEAKKGRKPRTEAIPGIIDSGNCCLINVSSCGPWSDHALDDILSRDGLEEENGRFRMSSNKLEDRNVGFAKLVNSCVVLPKRKHTNQARWRVSCRLPVNPPSLKAL